MDNRENTLRTQALRAVLLLFLSVSVHCSYAQNPTVRSYFLQEDLKHYSTEIVPTGASDPGVVMAGTYFGPAGAAGNPNYTHFVRTDNDGVVQAWQYYQEMGAGYEDERCIDIASNPSNHNQYFLTSLVRENQGMYYKDRIKIYEVDYNGIYQNSNIIESTGPSGYINIYPVHSLYDDATSALFICGYVLRDATLLTSNKQGPSYHGGTFPGRWEKEAFVMKIDPVTLAVLNYETYNYAYTAGAFNTLSTYDCPSIHDPANWNPVNQPTSPMWGDYDMAMRLTKIQGGMIHVTGSVTALHMACDDPNVAPGPMWNCQNTLASGIMNVVIDPTVGPGLQMQIFDQPFKDEEMDYSFGVGIFQDGGSYYLLGNHMTPEIRTGAGIVDENGFEPYMHGMFFVNLENIGGNPTPRYNPDPQTLYNTGIVNYNQPLANYSLIPYGPRGGQVENWAVTNIYSGLTPSSSSYDVVRWVAGYRANGPWLSGAGCSHTYPPSLANVTPSISLWELGWDNTNGISANIRTTKDHMTQFGTGPDVYGANSFRQLGEGLSNIGWPPTFAVGDDISNPTNPDIIMAVPFYTGNLNLKFIRANGLDGSMLRNNTDYCPNSVEECVPPLETPSHVVTTEGLEMRLVMPNVSPGTWTPRPPSNKFRNNTPDEVVCDAINNVFKPGKTTTVEGLVLSGEETIVYPNPAQQYVQVALAKGIGAEQAIKVVLTGVQGQVLSVLYEGNAAGLSADRQLQLPGLAAGLYFVQVYADGQPVCNQKLNVMQ